MTDESSAGVLLVDKPVGVTSFGVVAVVRRLLGGVRTGHGGTLDPFATGLLPLLIGPRATREASRFLLGDKEYRMTLRFGSETDTGDLCGRAVVVGRPSPTREQIESVLASFVGESQQEAPAYSAIKHRGRPLYWYARRGIAVQRPPRPVRIDRISLEEYYPPDAVFVVVCGKGAYMRVLARDIARAAGSAGHLVALRRLRVGPFSVEDAVPLWRLIERGAEQAMAYLMPLERL